MQSAQAMIKAGFSKPMNLQAAAAGSLASLLTVSLANPAPMLARFNGENERTWAQSIEADINNGAPAKAICINASSSAETSTEVPFKNWAYSIARQYCSSGYVQNGLTEASVTPSANPLGGNQSGCSLSSVDFYDLQNNRRLSKHGPDCSVFIKAH